MPKTETRTDSQQQIRRITTNLRSSESLIREDTFDGRECLVAPAVVVEEGVIEYEPGEGANPDQPTREFLSQEDIRNSVPHWEGQPFTISHPRKNGQSLNARAKEVLESSSIGWFFNAHEEDGKLKGEIWIDKDKAKSNPYGEKILNSVEQGEQVPVSTAYLPDPVKENGTFNGQSYEYRQTNLKPNHIAGLIHESPRSEDAAVPRLNSEGRIVTNQDVMVHDPQWNSTSTEDWSEPNLEDFGDDPDFADVDDHYLVSMEGFPPENFGDLKLPVVSPDGALNLNALRNAKARASQVEGLSGDALERTITKINNLANDNYEEANFTENAMNQNSHEDIKEWSENEARNWLQAKGFNPDNADLNLTENEFLFWFDDPSQVDTLDSDSTPAGMDFDQGVELIINQNIQFNQAPQVTIAGVKFWHGGNIESNMIGNSENSQMEKEEKLSLLQQLTNAFGLTDYEVTNPAGNEEAESKEEQDEVSEENDSTTNSESNSSEAEMADDNTENAVATESPEQVEEEELQDSDENPEASESTDTEEEEQQQQEDQDELTKEDLKKVVGELQNKVNVLESKLSETEEARQEIQEAHNSKRQNLIQDIASNGTAFEEDELSEWSIDRLRKLAETVRPNDYSGQGVTQPTTNSEEEDIELTENGAPMPPSVARKDDSGGDQ